jgi:hypothetical protein
MGNGVGGWSFGGGGQSRRGKAGGERPQHTTHIDRAPVTTSAPGLKPDPGPLPALFALAAAALSLSHTAGHTAPSLPTHTRTHPRWAGGPARGRRRHRRRRVRRRSCLDAWLCCVLSAVCARKGGGE